MLDWQCWHIDSWPLTVILGTERWEQWRWMLQRAAVLETDPGPLDAHVP